MGYTFDGSNKLIVLTTGTTSFDAIDLYSRWKDWVLLSDNSKYPAALTAIGGEPIDATNTVSPYFFLENGWKIRPHEANHTLTVNGTILVSGGTGSPFVSTLGSYNVSIRSVVPVQAQSVSAGAVNGAIWDEQLNDHTDPGSIGQAMKLIKTLSQILVSK